MHFMAPVRFACEKVEPGLTYGRQVATYALLVGIPYETEVDRFVDILVTDHGAEALTRTSPALRRID